MPAYVCFTALAGAAALLVALLVPEDQPDRRRTAFDILKLFFGSGSCLTALVGGVNHLAQAGLL
jgi:transcriptional regulator GlxA family with amidase domain